MAQLHIDATVTDGSANVTLPGDVRSEIKPGDYFKLVGIIGVYEIASRSLVSGNTRITLTAPYVGDSGTYPALVHRDFTERGYPLFYQGDLDIPDILRRWALQMDGEVTHAEDVAGEAVAAHVAQPDPHPQYTTDADAADVAVAVLGENIGPGPLQLTRNADFCTGAFIDWQWFEMYLKAKYGLSEV